MSSLARIHVRRCLCHSFIVSLTAHCSKPHARHRAYAASVHQRHELVSGRAAATFLLKFCRQPSSDLDHRSGEMKAGISHCRRLTLASSVCRSTVLLEVKNSPEMSHMTDSSCSVSSTSRQNVLLIPPGSTNIRFVSLNLDMPTNTISKLLKFERIRSRSLAR